MKLATFLSSSTTRMRIPDQLSRTRRALSMPPRTPCYARARRARPEPSLPAPGLRGDPRDRPPRQRGRARARGVRPRPGRLPRVAGAPPPAPRDPRGRGEREPRRQPRLLGGATLRPARRRAPAAAARARGAGPGAHRALRRAGRLRRSLRAGPAHRRGTARRRGRACRRSGSSPPISWAPSATSRGPSSRATAWATASATGSSGCAARSGLKEDLALFAAILALAGAAFIVMTWSPPAESRRPRRAVNSSGRSATAPRARAACEVDELVGVGDGEVVPARPRVPASPVRAEEPVEPHRAEPADPPRLPVHRENHGIGEHAAASGARGAARLPA